MTGFTSAAPLVMILEFTEPKLSLSSLEVPKHSRLAALIHRVTRLFVLFS